MVTKSFQFSFRFIQGFPYSLPLGRQKDAPAKKPKGNGHPQKFDLLLKGSRQGRSMSLIPGISRTSKFPPQKKQQQQQQQGYSLQGGHQLDGFSCFHSSPPPPKQQNSPRSLGSPGGIGEGRELAAVEEFDPAQWAWRAPRSNFRVSWGCNFDPG